MNKTILATLAVLSALTVSALATNVPAGYTCGDWGACSGLQYRTCINGSDRIEQVQTCQAQSDGAVVPLKSEPSNTCKLNTFVSRYCTLDSGYFNADTCKYVQRQKLFIICKDTTTDTYMQNFISNYYGNYMKTRDYMTRAGHYRFAWFTLNA